MAKIFTFFLLLACVFILVKSDSIPSNVSGQRYIERINVVYTDKSSGKPADAIRGIHGENPDMNAGFGGKYVWLTPIWTTDPTKAASSIELIVQDKKNPLYQDLASGARGKFRYLKMIVDPANKTKITDLGLWRTRDSKRTHDALGWKNCTKDINFKRGGDYLFLCWD